MKNYLLFIGFSFLVFLTSCTKEETYLGELGTFTMNNHPQKIDTRRTTFRPAKLKLNPSSGITENHVIDIIAESENGETRIVGSFSEDTYLGNGEFNSSARMLRINVQEGDYYYYAKTCCFDISSNKIRVNHHY